MYSGSETHWCAHNSRAWNRSWLSNLSINSNQIDQHDQSDLRINLIWGDTHKICFRPLSCGTKTEFSQHILISTWRLCCKALLDRPPLRPLVSTQVSSSFRLRLKINDPSKELMQFDWWLVRKENYGGKKTTSQLDGWWRLSGAVQTFEARQKKVGWLHLWGTRHGVLSFFSWFLPAVGHYNRQLTFLCEGDNICWP